MDNVGASSGQNELSISLAASSMINSSDIIPPETYQVNLKRIQDVKEIVRKLEMNNEAAHRNYLVDQLEKRARDGREAEDMLARLKNQPSLPEAVQFYNNVPSDKSDVVLPTTATLVEVPESHSSPTYSPAISSHTPQTIQPNRPAMFQWNPPTQIQPDVFRHYVPPPTIGQPPQHNAVPHSQIPVDPGQMGWYAMQNVPARSRVHNPLTHQTDSQQTQIQQPSQYWSGYSHQVITTPDTVPASGYYTSPVGRNRTAPANGDPSTSSSNPTYREPGFPLQSTVPRPTITTHTQSQNLSAPSFQVRMPLQSGPVVSSKTPSGQLPKPPDSQSRLVPTAVSKPVAISKLQRPHEPLQQSQQHQQQPQLQPQRLPQSPLQPQQHSQQLQSQSQRLPQPPLQPQQHPQQLQTQFPHQQHHQPPQAHIQVPPHSADRLSSASVSRPQSQPTQLFQPTTVQEQAWQRDLQRRGDQATFIRLFHTAVQRGILQLKAFWFQAKASGISEEWLKAAINSLPRDVWQSVMAQVNQSGPTINAPPPTTVLQQQLSTTPDPNVPVVHPIATPNTAPAIQQPPQPSTTVGGRIAHSAPRQSYGPYAAQVQYYAEQTMKSTLTSQAASNSTATPGNIAATQTAVVTPKRDVPQAHANVRTPKDANRSTLARDILRSLGKTVPDVRQEIGGEPTDKAEIDQLPEVTPSQPVPGVVPSESPVVPAATSLVDTYSASIPSAKPGIHDESQRAASRSPSIAKSVLRKEYGHATVTEGPIMIDLTLEDSDDSIGEKGQEHIHPILTSAATSPQPVSPANTTNHTPLLENLSLEEPPVDVSADADNADVRMYSPPLSLAAEENMDSELVYPPPGDAELVSPSFEPLPREASEHPQDSQLPLFLPSPPVSPPHTEPPETDLEMINDGSENRPSLKRRSINVDKMEIDTELVAPPRVNKRQKQQVYVLVPPAPPYVKKAIQKMKERAMVDDGDSEGVGEDEEIQYSHLEQLLIDESKSRLLERRCRWLNCGAVLNCAANLLAHLKDHVREEDSQTPFLCRWASCQRQFAMERERDVHLEKHTIRPLPCPFAGCDEQFDKPVEVMQHEVQHQKADRREALLHKPTCQPIVPAIPARLGPPPRWLPSHRVIPRRVVKCRISADRHATLGPWILWNIFSPVDLSLRKQNASMRGRPTRQEINYDVDGADARRDDYDFLLALSSYPAKNPQLDDLDSSLITMSAAQGLTLWGSGSHVNSAAGPGEYPNAMSVTLAVDVLGPSSVAEETRVEGKSDESDAAAAAREDRETEERELGQLMVTGEEDAVEKMLIL